MRRTGTKQKEGSLCMAEQPIRIKERLSLLDALRGFALLNMILYHLLYDIVYILSIQLVGIKVLPDMYGEQFICWSLYFTVRLLLFSLGSRLIKRDCLYWVWDVSLSVVTMFVMPEQRVRFWNT